MDVEPNSDPIDPFVAARRQPTAVYERLHRLLTSNDDSGSMYSNDDTRREA